MVGQNKSDDDKDLRIRIKKKDLENLVEPQTPLALIHQWIKLGREQYDRKENPKKNTEKNLEILENKIDKISQDLESFIFLSMQVFELITVSGTMDQMDAHELIRNEGGSYPQYYQHFKAKLAREKAFKFKELAQKIFPELEFSLLMYAKSKEAAKGIKEMEE